MSRALIDERDIVGFPTHVFADDTGIFSIQDATTDGDGSPRTLGRGNTLDKAVTDARTELNKRRVEVAVRFITPAGKRAVATRRHGKNNTVLTRVGATSEQMDPWSNVFPGETPDEIIEEYLRLKKEQAELAPKVRDIEARHMVRLGQIVDEAVQEKLSGREEPE